MPISIPARFRNDRKIRGKLWRALSFLLVGLFFASKAVNEHAVANRQQSTYGIITACQSGSKGRNSCSYTFPVADRQFAGYISVAPGVRYQEGVLVFYDPRDPSTNATDDFSRKSRNDGAFALGALILSAAIVAYVLFD